MIKRIAILCMLIGGIMINVAHANTIAVIKTNKGDIEIELFDEQAPKTVENFINYVNDGFYDGTIFHRVIDGFMIQGGGLDQSFKVKPNNAPIQNEANNGISNSVGTIAMARTSAPHSATSQFFINTVNNNFLDYKAETNQGYGYAVFGKVIKGMDVVNQISKVKTKDFMGYSDVPAESIIIEKVEIIKTPQKEVSE